MRKTRRLLASPSINYSHISHLLTSTSVYSFYLLSTSPPRYAKSVLGAFSKTVASGLFPVVVVDNINVRVCDFEPFWGNAKRAGFEVYVRCGCMGVCMWAYGHMCMCMCA